LAFSCSKEETLLPAGDELTDVLKKATVIDDEIYLCGSMLFDVVAPKEKENKVIISSDWMFLDMYAKLSPDPENKGHYTLLTREWMPGPGGFEFRVVEYDARITPGGAVQFFWPGTDKWWEFMGVPFENCVEQVIAHTGVDVHGPGINKGTIMFEGYLKNSKFHASTHLSGLQLYVPLMDAYWNGKDPAVDPLPFIEGPVQLNFTMEMEVCEYSDFPWDIDLPF
ncbi:MAG: hypothetical protein ACWGNV_14410, partial [Bacteroidales bacterium]